MIRGDKYIISKQIGNILMSRPESNVAEVKSFVEGNILFKIGKMQYILPINIFSGYIIEKISPDKPKEIRIATAAVNKTPFVITKPDVTPTEPTTEPVHNDTTPEPTTKPAPNDTTPEPTTEPDTKPDNTIITPPDPDEDLYDND